LGNPAKDWSPIEEGVAVFVLPSCFMLHNLGSPEVVSHYVCENVTRISYWTQKVVFYAAFVRGRHATRGALVDDPENGCVGDYIERG